MRLPHALKVGLIEKFSPILYLDPSEPDYPVSPVAYVERAALWSSQPPQHAKAGWGVPAGSDRLPLIPHRGISLNPAHDVAGAADPDGDGVPEHYLGQSDQGTFPFLVSRGHDLWLDLASWQDGAKVTPVSLNRRAAGAEGADLAQPWFSADVWSMSDMSSTLGAAAMSGRFGLGPDDHPDALAGLVVVAYHFLFPVHRQRRRQTAHTPESDPYSGDYEGDWATFAVVTRGPVDAGDGLRVEDCVPVHAAFGQRWRPTSPDHDGHVYERMLLRPWSEVLRVGDHAAVVAAIGTHNLYPHDTPVNPDGTITPQFIGEGQSASEPANSFVRDSTEEPYAAVLALKIIALGIIGVILAAAEASDAEEEGLYKVPDVDPSPPPESDDPLAEDAADIEKSKVGSKLTAESIPLIDPAQAEVRQWVCSADDSLVDDSLVLSPYGNVDRPTFAGRWGVRCESDPFLLRTGINFPGYRAQIVDAMLKGAS
jgi:hypothetical protein